MENWRQADRREERHREREREREKDGKLKKIKEKWRERKVGKMKN